ncbi:MAG TPA: TerC family protein [Acidimicrobiales bacterium]|nr:TerC family protein [Acidimicrobiales bacterium]
MLAALNHLAVAVAEDVETREKFAYLDVEVWHWLALLAFIVTLVVIDLLLVHRTAHVITIKEATIESAVWISIGLAFTGVIFLMGADGDQGQAATEYLSGFLIEKSLSIDNVFVWAVIFSFFAVPREYQFRVLFWGIFGALVLRAGFIVAGTALIESFDFVLYVFGAFLIYTAWKIAHHDETEVVDYNQNIAMRAVRRLVRTTNEYDGQKLFTVQNAKRLATPLFAVLVLIEATDVVFAVDSVPAILAVSREKFIVFSSNAFAILGLRSLFFLLGGMAGKFRYLNVGLGVILAYVGVKMLLVGPPVEWHPPTYLSLVVIGIVLTVAIVASLRADTREHDRDDTVAHELADRDDLS